MNGIREKSIGLCILWSFLTCGIYMYYWVYTLNDEINELSGNRDATSGGMVILFMIITCGIYGWYWIYKMGERVDTIKGSSDSNAVLFIILQIVGLGIVNYAIMQDVINREVRGTY